VFEPWILKVINIRLDALKWLISFNYLYTKPLHLLDFVRGSRGPSTVTLMALLYVAIWKGVELMTMVSEKLFPATEKQLLGVRSSSVLCTVDD